ncbi:MAG TPA: EVE domain-containing protein [Acidobacteriaceae bacterium]|nr:EVE domain-containing protein [Acidobacteriaceae bacterium]
MPYLFKTEPDVYSFADLERDEETDWDGVANPQALRYLREMQPGEQVAIYHSGDERCVVGTAEVLTVDAHDPKIPVVRVRRGRSVPRKTLAVIKQEVLFKDSPLVRQSRLSVVPLTPEQFHWLIGMERNAAENS